MAFAPDREGRRAIAAHRRAADILQQRFAAPDVVAEFRGRLLVERDMVRAVAGQFVPLGDDAPHQLRMRSATQPSVKNVPLDAGVGEHIEEPLGVPRRPGAARLSQSLAIDHPAKASTWK